MTAIKANVDGVVEWFADGGTEVSKGDVVIKFKGSAKIEKAIAHLEERIKVYEDRAARAMSKGDEAKAKRAEAKVEVKKRGLIDDKATLAALSVVAAKDGVFAAKVKKRRAFTSGDELGTIEGIAVNEAVFELPEGVVKSGHVEVTAADGTSAQCEVVNTDGQKITARCSGALPAGSQVSLAL